MTSKSAAKTVAGNAQQKRIIREFDSLKKRFESFAVLLNKNPSQSARGMKKEKSVTPTRSDADRPTVREAVREHILANGPTSAIDLHHMATEKHGGYSRHSLYRVLHDEREFKLNSDNKYELVQKSAASKKAGAVAA